MTTEALLSIIFMCAPEIAPNTILQIIRVESGGNPLAINVNGIQNKIIAESTKEAANITRDYIKLGYSVDVGLMQINSKNFKYLGYQDEEIELLFEPCNNINAGAQILQNFYKKSLKHYQNPNQALRAAISAYNTGDFEKGIANGYVHKVYQQTINSNSSLLEQALNAPTLVQFQLQKTGENHESKIY